MVYYDNVNELDNDNDNNNNNDNGNDNDNRIINKIWIQYITNKVYIKLT